MRIAKFLPFVLLLAGCPGPGALEVKGTVLDQKGKAIPGAVVSDGKFSTCTDESGAFSLMSTETKVSIRKTRYQPVEAEGRDLTIVLPPKNGVTVGWNSSANATSVKSEGIRAHLGQNGFSLVAFEGEIPSCDVVVLPCPSLLSSETRSKLRSWVQSGGMLVLFGEWGGYPYFDTDGANSLLNDTGISFSGGTINWYDPLDKEKPEWLPIRSFTSQKLLDGVNGVLLFTTGTLDVKSPGVPLALSNSESFRINGFSKGSQTVAAYAPFGRGKITVWADASFLSDTDTKGSGTPDWKQSNNPAALLNTLNW